ncbi:MAG: zinc-ribbon domain-containing protein [Lachnospiraceae bacterium]|nr:zinc-ribbon domain-containing protein [Lachnospiraceae bacterium]
MYCHVCGSKIPDGDMFCPACGAGQRTSKTTQHTDTTEQKPMFRAGVAEPLRDFYTVRKVLTIFGGLVLVALVILWFYYLSEGRESSLIPYFMIGIVRSMGTLAVAIWQLLVLNELRSYEERYGKVILLVLLSSVFSVVSAFAKDNFGLVIVFSLLNTAVDIWAYYHLCRAFSNLARPWDSGIADAWSFVFGLYVVIQASSFFIRMVLSLDGGHYSEWIHIVFLSCLVSAAGVARFVYELVYIKKTIGVFERGRNSDDIERMQGLGGDSHEVQQLQRAASGRQ